MTNIEEKWLPIIGYEGYYEVSNYGSVKSLSRPRNNTVGIVKERLLKLNKDSCGYPTVKLYKEGLKKTPKIHRLVCQSFIVNNDPVINNEINHIDGDKTNNFIDNLEWCSRKWNMNHADYLGLRNIKGEGSHTSKLTTDDVFYILTELRIGLHNQQYLADKFNVTFSTINHIKTNRTWKHLSR